MGGQAMLPKMFPLWNTNFHSFASMCCLFSHCLSTISKLKQLLKFSSKALLNYNFLFCWWPCQLLSLVNTILLVLPNIVAQEVCWLGSHFSLCSDAWSASRLGWMLAHHPRFLSAQSWTHPLDGSVHIQARCSFSFMPFQKYLQKHPDRYIPVCFHGDSKSHWVDNKH